MAQLVKDPPAMQETQETQVWSLVREDPLKKEMATCPSILAWKIPWTEEPGGLQFMRSRRIRHTSQLKSITTDTIRYNRYSAVSSPQKKRNLFEDESPVRLRYLSNFLVRTQ